jgi:hypothetical protein
MTIETDKDFEQLAGMAVPVKRAAYSDRTAWIMALLAEIAYTPLDEESDDLLLTLAGELAAVTNQEQIAERLRELRKTLSVLDGGGEDTQNERLTAALRAGGFDLAGGRPLHHPGTDTQGFVAVRQPQGDDIGMAVICFRGTKQVKDWMTNLKIEPHPIDDPRNNGEVIGHMHKGFHEAYVSVHGDIKTRLQGHEQLPLYITGHSLGGALAVVATWYQSAQRLAACYTFGAPRVGDDGLMDWFKTPIYRVVNGPDPVPFVPPSKRAITTLKSLLRIIGSLLPFLDAIDWLVKLLIRHQGFRHYGDMRYLTVQRSLAGGGEKKPKMEFHLGSLERLIRFIGLFSSGQASTSTTRWSCIARNCAPSPSSTMKSGVTGCRCP